MATTIALDPRFPIPDSLSTTDPTHPLQLVKTATEVQNQAAADTKYDIGVPTRFRSSGGGVSAAKAQAKEGFRSPLQGTKYVPHVVIVLLVFLSYVWLYVKSKMRRIYISIFIIMLAIGLLFFTLKKEFQQLYYFYRVMVWLG